MKQAIIVTSTPSNGQWLQNCLQSFREYDKYRIIVLCDYTFELGKIHWVIKHTDLDEFFILHDTCEIKDLTLFDIVFEKYKGKSVSLSSHPAIFGMYLGKYRRSILKNMQIPLPTSKIEVVEYEMSFNEQYLKRDPKTVVLFPDFKDNFVFENKLGRVNMRLENEYLIKWKGSWNRKMVAEMVKNTKDKNLRTV